MKSKALFRPRSFNSSSIVAVAILINLSIYFLEPLPLQSIRNHLFDQYQRWQPREYVDVGVRIIDIDDTSLKMMGQWPWPRSRIATFLEQLTSLNIKVLGFDFIFAEPDRTSPSNLIPLWQLPNKVKTQLLALPDHDQLLANALHNLPAVLGFAAEHDTEISILPQQPFRVITLGDNPTPFIPKFHHTISSLSLLEHQAQGNGALIFLPDIDGFVRKIPLLINVMEKLYPSFATEIVRVSTQQQNYLLKSRERNSLGVEYLKIGNDFIPTNSNGEMWIYYTANNPQRTIPIWKILTNEIPLSSLNGKLLLFGTSAEGLADLRFSPVTGVIPGIEIHAQAVEQILNHVFLLRPSWAKGIEFITIIIFGVLAAWLGLRHNITLSSSGMFVMLIGLSLIGWYAFTYKGWLIDTLNPSFAILSIYFLCGFIRHKRTEQRQRWVRKVFSRYVSPNLVKYLMDHPGQIELNALRRECSFILTDLADSTPFMEYTDPAVVANCINTYLDRMIAIAFSFEGTLTRIIGDGIVILFSAPIPQPDHHQRAIECALAMQDFAQSYAVELRTKGINFCSTRIGVNSGQVLVGNFGGNSIFDYRALGDPINTASRLESVNKHIGTSICIAASCFENTSKIGKRPIGQLHLKGKSTPLLAYEPLGIGVASDTDYEQAYQLLTSNPQSAKEAFKTLVQQRPNDPLIAFHWQRLQNGEYGNDIIFTEK